MVIDNPLQFTLNIQVLLLLLLRRIIKDTLILNNSNLNIRIIFLNLLSYSQIPAQQQYGGPSTAGVQPGGETAASAYMQQYRAQNSTPAPPQQQQQQNVLQSQQRQSSYNNPQQPPAQGMEEFQLNKQQQQPQWQQQQPQPPINQTQPQVVASQQVQQQPPAQSNGQPHPPTGQFSDSVKALYDYSETMEEEFSFTAGDIIAVTHTEADGWWQGELLDEARRRPGSKHFPSNFVVLLM
ncbi:hypothetical protein L7F22_037346 [Adiantum nelumboides]|nr:hypothetical protein [Adiantum nelumboides]